MKYCPATGALTCARCRPAPPSVNVDPMTAGRPMASHLSAKTILTIHPRPLHLPTPPGRPERLPRRCPAPRPVLRRGPRNVLPSRRPPRVLLTLGDLCPDRWRDLCIALLQFHRFWRGHYLDCAASEVACARKTRRHHHGPPERVDRMSATGHWRPEWVTLAYLAACRQSITQLRQGQYTLKAIATNVFDWPLSSGVWLLTC